MYESVAIRNFKLFRHLRVEGFQRINLVTGRNNSGKSALLEALFVHSGAANIHLPFAIEAFRGVTQFRGSPDAALADLFHSFDVLSPIEIETADKLGTK